MQSSPDPTVTPSQSIEQINMAYDADEDRLILRAGLNGDKEIPIWISYRIARQLFRVLNEVAHLPVSPAQGGMAVSVSDPATAQQDFVQEFEAVQALESLDFDSAYQPRESVVSSGPLLVVATQFTRVDQQLHAMDLRCNNGATIQVNLSPQLVLALSRMLQMAANEAGWQLPTSNAALSTHATQSSGLSTPVVH